MFTYVFDAASETLVCLQHFSISLSTKTNLKQRPVWNIQKHKNITYLGGRVTQSKMIQM